MNFDFNKIKDFDTHIQSSIPNYTELKEMVASIAHHLVPDEGTVVDIGCSTGAVLELIHEKIPNIRCIGVDIASNLFPKDSPVAFLTEDITEFTPVGDLIISMFTLQFLPMPDRIDLLRRIKHWNPSSSIIVTEKCYMESGKNQEMFTFSYYDYKSKSFSADELLSKQKSIRTIMKPLTEQENISMFEKSGYTVTRFWQSLQFVGWILTPKS
jgi:tRNA (cmo5U34)-methyltransferase